MTADFNVDQLIKLAADLNRAGKIAPEASSKALTGIARKLRDDARSSAPVDSGALRDSIKVSGSRGSRTVYSDVRYAAFVEFGTSDTPPQPFLWPAVPAARKALIEGLVDIGTEALD